MIILNPFKVLKKIIEEHQRFFIFRFLIHLKRFIQLVFSRFIEDQGLKNAAALSYTTTLSLIPLMTVILAIFSTFPIADEVSLIVQDFIFNNFVPASSQVLEQYFQEFSAKASRLPAMGVAFLIVVALMLISSVNDTLNLIWRVKKRRRILAQFLVYWSMLTLGPVLIGASVATTSYLISLPIFDVEDGRVSIQEFLVKVLPIFTSFVAFSLMYSIVPNRKVPFKHAVMGGMLAAGLFELAKLGFAFYVATFPTYQAIYGTLAIVPIFLIWVYLSWVITLFAAEFTYCLGLYWHYHERKKVIGDHLLDVYHIIKILREAQVTGTSVNLPQLSNIIQGLPEERIESLMIILQKFNLVINTEHGAWVLAQDLSYVRLEWLYRVHPWVLPKLTQLKYVLPDEKRFIQAIEKIANTTHHEFDASLEYFLKGEMVSGILPKPVEDFTP